MPANAQPIRAPCGLHPAPPLLGAGGQRGAVRAALAAGVRAPRAATLQRLHTQLNTFEDTFKIAHSDLHTKIENKKVQRQHCYRKSCSRWSGSLSR